jgi:hypothetical protein
MEHQKLWIRWRRIKAALDCESNDIFELIEISQGIKTFCFIQKPY